MMPLFPWWFHFVIAIACAFFAGKDHSEGNNVTFWVSLFFCVGNALAALMERT